MIQLRFGCGVRRPFFGIERERLVTGSVIRVSVWPMCAGVYVAWWRE